MCRSTGVQRAALHWRGDQGRPIKHDGTVVTEQELRWHAMRLGGVEHWRRVTDGEVADVARHVMQRWRTSPTAWGAHRQMPQVMQR